MHSSEPAEVEFVAADAEVFDDVGDDAARHVARMPRERDEAVGAKRIGVMPMTAGSAKECAADFSQTAIKLPTVPRGILAHGSGGENEFVAEGGRDRAARFQQRFQMRFCRLLKAKGGFAAVASVRVAAGQQAGFGDPHAVFVLTELHFRKWNDHNAATVTRPVSGVKRHVEELNPRESAQNTEMNPTPHPKPSPRPPGRGGEGQSRLERRMERRLNR